MRRASVRRSALVGEDQMLRGCALAVLGQRKNALLDRLVEHGLPLGVLAQVLFPGVDQVVLDEAVRVAGVLVEAPALGAGAGPRAAETLHLVAEALVILRSDAVLERNQDRPVGIGLQRQLGLGPV